MSDSTKIHEDRLRRALYKRGFRLCKTPARSWLRKHYGPGYIIVDWTNTVREGCCSRAYEATLEDVEAFIVRHDTRVASAGR
jgi:hypothetical protein